MGRLVKSERILNHGKRQAGGMECDDVMSIWYSTVSYVNSVNFVAPPSYRQVLQFHRSSRVLFMREKSPHHQIS